jgi:hypothetical protein
VVQFGTPEEVYDFPLDEVDGAEELCHELAFGKEVILMRN